MRKIALTIFSLWTLASSGQITIRDNVVNKEVLKPEAYDSLSSFRYSWDKYENSYEGISRTESVRRSDYELLKFIGHKIYFIPFAKTPDNKGDLSFHLQRSEQVSKNIPSNELREFKYILEPLRKENPKKYEADYQKRKKYFEDIITAKVLTDVYKPSFYITAFDVTNNAPNGYFVTPYEAFQGKYFEIIDFEIEASEYPKGSDLIKMILKDAAGDTLLLVKSKQEWNWERQPPFILLSRYEKLKNQYVNQTFIVSSTSTTNESIDINTGAAVKISKESEWQCVSLDFVNSGGSYLELFLIFKNDLNQEIKVPVETNERNYKKIGRKDFILKEAWQEQKRLAELSELERKARIEENERKAKEYEARRKALNIEKFGISYGGLINEGKVKLGMSKDMCIAAWGSPLSINRTTVTGLIHEQWVYSLKHYLYFENGELTAIQN